MCLTLFIHIPICLLHKVFIDEELEIPGYLSVDCPTAWLIFSALFEAISQIRPATR